MWDVNNINSINKQGDYYVD